MSLASPTLAGGFFTTSVTWEAPGQILPVFKYMKDDDIKENLYGPRGRQEEMSQFNVLKTF